MSYVYVRSEPGLWTVGIERPDGTWEPESDHESSEAAAKRVHYLNGGCTEPCKSSARSTATREAPSDSPSDGVSSEVLL
jgi:hypothetical protein